MDEVKISRFQLVVMIIGFSYGIIINLSTDVKQDAWLVFVMASVISLCAVLLYSYLSVLNPGLNLVSMVKYHFGKVFGSIIGFSYALFFLFLASLVIRNFSNFVTIAIFPETPMIAVIISMAVVIMYIAYQGLEVIGRASEIFVPLIPVSVITVTILLLTSIDIKNWKPFLENGIEPVLRNLIIISGYPVGHLVVFLMVFPYVNINKKKDLILTAVTGVIVIDLIFMIVNTRDLFVLGASLFYRSVYPSASAIRFIPNMNLDSLYLVTLLIGGGIKVVICIYASASALMHTFNINDYRIFVIPLIIIMVFISNFIFESLFQSFHFIKSYYFYFSYPFQYLIPLLLLIISLIKKKRGEHRNFK